MRKNEYSVPKAVYYQCIWLVKDMDRLRKLEAVSNYAAKEDELVFFAACRDPDCHAALEMRFAAGIAARYVDAELVHGIEAREQHADQIVLPLRGPGGGGKKADAQRQSRQAGNQANCFHRRYRRLKSRTMSRSAQNRA